jgi:hypothetical protein
LPKDDMTTDDPYEPIPAGDTTAETTADDVAVESDGEADPVVRRRWRRVAAPVLTVLAALFVLFALVAPEEISSFSLAAFVRIPVEGLVGLAVLLVLPMRARRVVAAILGVILGLLTIVKIIDMGFFVALARPFDPAYDWSFFGPAMDFLKGSFGEAGAIGALIGAGILAVGVVALMTLAVGRLTRLAAGHRRYASQTVLGLAVIWIVCALVGVQFTAGEPLASRTAAALAYDDVRQVRDDVADQKEFAEQEAVDAFADVPGDQLLHGLRGKNVLLTFVESYGRVAVQDSALSKPIDAELDAGTKALDAAGFGSRSGFLTSSTEGGASWLAHTSIETGLFVNSERRYDDVLASNRLTLSNAFERAGWRTVVDVPSNITDLPKSALYDYDKFYDALNVGYRGPNFSYATMPDQYIMQAFQNNELAKPGHPPVMAEIDLVSSHSPWAPLPRMVPWSQLGNGSIFDAQAKEGPQPSDLLSPDKIRAAYGQSIQYTLSALISYLQTYGDKNTVLIFLGDHQPAPLVSGVGATRDVPITIVAKDPKVLDKISSWDWQSGLRPGPDAPVWRMDTFRNKFLTAFGS